MNTNTLEKLNRMKFHGMHRAFKTALETGKSDDYTLDEFIAYLVESEYDDRQMRKIDRYIKTARFRYKAALEEISYEKERNLDKNQVLRLAEGCYIDSAENLIITGSTGAGKSYLSCALGHHACAQGYRVMYFNTAKLFAKMKMAKADGSYLKEMLKLEKQHLVVLDDFGLQPMDGQSRMILLELVEDRHGKGAMIFTSQIPVTAWYEIIGEKTVADAILDRIVHQSHRIELKGESMRKKRTKQQTNNV